MPGSRQRELRLRGVSDIMLFYEGPSRTCPNCKRQNMKIRPTGVNDHGIPDGPLWVCKKCELMTENNELIADLL